MKKGFTLIELLAVIVILSIILLIAVPIVLSVINDSKAESANDSVELYGRSIEQALANFYMKNPEKETVTLQELKDGEYLQYKGTAPECNETIVRNKKVYLGGCKVGKTNTDTTYGEYIPQPDLDNGLTPVVYRNNNWVVVDSTDDEWYDYDEQKWANAVVLRNDVEKNTGDTVTVEGTNPEALMMLVWIPRYEYKYTNLGEQYAGGTQDQPGGIDINFISKSITKESSNEYKIHPAFIFGTEEESGFWVGKFELSHTTKSKGKDNDELDYEQSNLNCNNRNCQEAQNLRILPNVPSLRYNNVSNFWYGIKSIENTSVFGLINIDIHMIKNSEWGAIAYLSQSKYGKYGNKDYEGSKKEVYQNKSSSYITGSSNGTPSQSTSYTRCTYNQKTGTNENQDQNNCGSGASTTGNIYGVYDMSGGSYEFVIGLYMVETSQISNTGFSNENFFGNSSNLIELKYYDKYLTENISTACNGICYGHALSETLSWYNDNSSFIKLALPVLQRSGIWSSNSAGIFYFHYATGLANNQVSTRLIFIEK